MEISIRGHPTELLAMHDKALQKTYCKSYSCGFASVSENRLAVFSPSLIDIFSSQAYHRSYAVR